MEQKINELEIDYSKMTIFDGVCENILLSEELLEKYKIVIDEAKIERIIAEIPEEQRHTLTFEEKLQYIRKILDSDVSDLFNDVINFVSKL